MTSKKQLRAEIERLRYVNGHSWLAGFEAAPGFFYGFAADCWQAFALAVYMADTLTGRGQVA